MRVFAALGAALSALLLTASVAVGPSAFPLQAMRDASVIVYDASGGGHGSGVIVGAATVLTAAHVTDGAKTMMISFDDGQAREGLVVFENSEFDFAIIQVPAPDAFKPASLACRAALWGEAVATVGNPVSLTHNVSFGHVSSVDPIVMRVRGAIALDLSITFGSSGGPVFDTDGNVLGLAIAIQTTRVGQSGFSYMTPVVNFCDQIPVADADG